MDSKNTDARRKASRKYLNEKVEDIKIRVPIGQKQIIKDYAESKGKSLNQFVSDAIDYSMNHDIYNE